MSPKRVLIIHEDPLAGWGLNDLLRSGSEAEFVPSVEDDLAEAVPSALTKRPDAVILGCSRLDSRLLEAVVTLVRAARLHVIVVSGDDRVDAVQSLLRAGAAAYIHMKLPLEEFKAHLKRALSGESVVAVPNPGEWLIKAIQRPSNLR